MSYGLMSYPLKYSLLKSRSSESNPPILIDKFKKIINPLVIEP
jgi:hypothetical protein